MGFWGWLFGVSGHKKIDIDWLEIESRQRQIEALPKQGQLGYKQAIVEYDKLIDGLMKELITGTTFAERLKGLRAKFPKGLYSSLWKAHIKRNELVHDSGSYVADWELMDFMRSYRDSVSFLRSLSIR
ncbi:hypothetical protein A3A71_01370 [Candidatus Berkelbacteria bacterium RIFCSPLOWO2_01_FULL_50_28]|uniref:DUF4145 domain-containing protein n=1 Tax=Candidatus Berkelbacteria bacterium RIFCSPLOWO2_01_FULL_50_28 TaxID=1797471 RepID=A0A1F5EB97_9BACT|nr:MAG: hypothetical protein A2807_01940 [Candidatus Berkelbacteria bacterium RIFCSPHIGHO2_01_FULL_50_36]OGD64002.1 MAG: hypothetical protein A3F39_02930 [Candidatus Berkelbacteria bacterium RIFCSPHIGHO2_12_FULL_50_11]OGD64687.1 MAG: hypothetical protein A3A71_01370 [Candidatus Berkelbacteria bacterium RIFCSPLOWO2_01_FULL_50_28]